MPRVPLLAIPLALLAACGGDGGGGEATASSPLEPLQRLERQPYTGPVDRGAEAGSPPATAAPRLMVTSDADGGAGSLRAALAEAADGDVIAIHPALAGAVTMPRVPLVIEDDVTITAADAPGFTIDGRGRTRLLETGYRSAVVLIGLRLCRGLATGDSDAEAEGGAIRSGPYGSLALHHCRFEHNRADRGGAVRSGYAQALTVEHCTFLGNDGSGAADGWSAGAIATAGGGELVVRRSWFEDNRGHTGGAIYNLLQPMTLEDCTFLFNWSGANGGAIFTDQGNHDGPGATEGGHLTLRRCWIQDNHTLGGGGGMMLWANHLDRVSVSDCVVFHNRVDRDHNTVSLGGGLRTRGEVLIERSAFVANRVEGQGGGAWIDGRGPIVISDSTFSDNRVSEGAGGAIFLWHQAGTEVLLRHCTLVYNHARYDGAFHLPRAANGTTLANSIVADNQASADPRRAQVLHPPEIAAGCVIEHPAPAPGGARVAADSVLAEPRLFELAQYGEMLYHGLRPDSPAIDAGDPEHGTLIDTLGHLRDGAPDSGAVERPALAGR